MRLRKCRVKHSKDLIQGDCWLGFWLSDVLIFNDVAASSVSFHETEY